MTPELQSTIEGFLSLQRSPIVEGWAEMVKVRPMVDLILREKPSVVVEIGVFGGRSLIPQALACRDNGVGTVYGIDPWKKEVAVEGVNDPANDAWWTGLDLHNIHRLCVEEIWRYGLDDFCVLARCSSQSCVKLFPKIDVLHIDGCHSELASCRDVTNYLPSVRNGGFVWFDDTNWATTQKAVAMVQSRCDKVEQYDNFALFRKIA